MKSVEDSFPKYKVFVDRFYVKKDNVAVKHDIEMILQWLAKSNCDATCLKKLRKTAGGPEQAERRGQEFTE